MLLFSSTLSSSSWRWFLPLFSFVVLFNNKSKKQLSLDPKLLGKCNDDDDRKSSTPPPVWPDWAISWKFLATNVWAAAIVPRYRLRLPSCCCRFESRAQSTLFSICTIEIVMGKGQKKETGFWPIYKTNFLTKVVQILSDLGGLFWKYHFLGKTASATFWIFGLFFIATSGHTGLAADAASGFRRSS